MRRPHDQRQWLGQQQFEAQAAHQRRIAHAADHQVEFTGPQFVEQFGVARRLDKQLQRRPARAQRCQRLRQQRRPQARQRAQAQPFRPLAGLRRERLRAGLDRFENAQRVRQQGLAGRRQPLHAAPPGAAALDQPGAGQRLQFGKRLGHGRLAQRQPLRRACQVALLRHRDKTAQMSQLDVAGERRRQGTGLQLPMLMKNA